MELGVVAWPGLPVRPYRADDGVVEEDAAVEGGLERIRDIQDRPGDDLDFRRDRGRVQLALAGEDRLVPAPANDKRIIPLIISPRVVRGLKFGFRMFRKIS